MHGKNCVCQSISRKVEDGLNLGQPHFGNTLFQFQEETVIFTICFTGNTKSVLKIFWSCLLFWIFLVKYFENICLLTLIKKYLQPVMNSKKRLMHSCLYFVPLAPLFFLWQQWAVKARLAKCSALQTMRVCSGQGINAASRHCATTWISKLAVASFITIIWNTQKSPTKPQISIGNR